MDRSFANEILSQIVNYLKNDQSSLLGLNKSCKKLHNLTTPLLYKIPKFHTFSRFEQFANSLSIENGKHVCHLDLHMVPHRWNSSKINRLLYMITEKTPDLELLNLDLCSQLTSKALIRITKPLSDLRILSVDQCEFINDDAIEGLIVNCPYLQELYLGSTHITDNALNEIGSHLILLTHLYIPGCEYVTEIGINRVIRERKTLKYIDYRDCYNVIGQLDPLQQQQDIDIQHPELMDEYINGEPLTDDQWTDMEDDDNSVF